MAATFLRPVEGLSPGDHACLVYDDERRRDRMLLAFLAQGLDRGDRVVYIAREPHDPVASELSRQGEGGQVSVVTAEDCYLHDGAFDAERALEGFRSVLAEAAARGFSTVRSAGGPPPAVTQNGSSHLLPAYERRAHALFADGRLVSVCAYDARRVAATALLGVVDAHPLVLYALDGNERLEVRVTSETSLAPAGWIDVTTLGSLTEPLARAIGYGDDVVVDLRDVDFVDVAGLRLLVEAARELDARGRRLRLTHLPGPVPTMIALLGYDEEPGLEVA